jgi:type I restriction enzyme S subunit
MSWDIVKLVDICTPKQWKTISTSDLLPEGYPVYGANGKIGFYNKFTHEHPTVMITCRGATCGTINISEPKSYINGNAMALDNLKETVHFKYLFYFLCQYEFKNVISGSAQPQITGQGLQNLTLPLPPIHIQKQIADTLDLADTLRRKDSEILIKYSELAQSIFYEMFGDPIKNEKHWVISSLKSLTKLITYGLTTRPEYINDGIPLISARELRSGYVDYERAPKISLTDFNKLSEKAKPKYGDILFSKTGSIGLSALVETNKGFAITQNAARITFDLTSLNIVYILELLRNPSFLSFCNNLAKGNAVKDLQLGDFSKIEVPIPPIYLQNSYSERIKTINKAIVIQTQSVKKTESIFQKINNDIFK